jgi:hypothetical protein
MRGIVDLVAVVVILAATASTSGAVNGTVACDKMKTAAAAKGFTEFLSCSHRGFADASFDLGVCRTRAYEKCVKKFGIADARFAGSCAFTANGPPSCLETLDAANTIFSGL